MDVALDDDCLRAIFGGLPLNDALRFEAVDKRWQTLLFDQRPQLTTFELRAPKRTTARSVAYAVRKMGEGLKRIRLEQPGIDVDESLVDSIANNATELLQLICIDATFNSSALRRLGALTRLQSLSFERCTTRRRRGRHDGEAMLKASLSSLPNLRYFAAASCDFCSSPSLLPGLTSASLLAVSFNADSTASDADAGADLVNFIVRQRALTFLELSGFTLGMQYGDAFWQALSPCLDVLMLRNIRSVALSFAALRTFRNLSVIDCSVDFADAAVQQYLYQFTDEDVIEICGGNPNLIELRLVGRCSLLTAYAFTHGYARLRKLASFHVSANAHIDDAAFEDVCESNARTLRVIVVDAAPNVSTVALRKALTICERLRRLVMQADGLTGDNFSPNALRQLVDDLPPRAAGCELVLRVLNPHPTVDCRCLTSVPANVSIKYLAVGEPTEWRISSRAEWTPAGMIALRLDRPTPGGACVASLFDTLDFFNRSSTAADSPFGDIHFSCLQWFVTGIAAALTCAPVWPMATTCEFGLTLLTLLLFRLARRSLLQAAALHHLIRRCSCVTCAQSLMKFQIPYMFLTFWYLAYVLVYPLVARAAALDDAFSMTVLALLLANAYANRRTYCTAVFMFCVGDGAVCLFDTADSASASQ